MGEQEGGGEDCWIYMHMPYSGGNGVRELLVERLRDEEALFDTVQWRKGRSYAMNLMGQSRWRVLHGGCVESLRQYGGKKCKWFTVFSHPIARLLAAFQHCREDPDDPSCPTTVSSGGQSPDLLAFAEHWGNRALRQFAMYNISSDAASDWAAASGRGKSLPSWDLVAEYLGRHGDADDESGSELDAFLETAQDTLRSKYDAVGVVESFGATLQLFDKALGIPGVKWSAEMNAPPDGALRREVMLEAMGDPRIQHYLRLDIRLYELALEIFQEQASHYGVL